MAILVNAKRAKLSATIAKLKISREEMTECTKIGRSLSAGIKRAFLSGDVEFKSDWYTLDRRFTSVLLSWLESEGYYVEVRLSEDENQRRFYVKW